MKTITTKGTLINGEGYIEAHGVTVIDHGDTISIGRPDGVSFSASPCSGSHTPGPWHVHNGYIKYGWHHDNTVAQVRNGSLEEYPNADANARLIASAPDLLDVMTEFLADQETMNEPYRNEAICERARALLNKVEGRSSLPNA
jgi:hypothetical protein